ncbi:carboxymuconolactone decarboxylase family protein [Stackebrandtia albiflava]|nr:carboxymuconolactone decarboxylase family protein [Stackebrandtia albiflava]
MKNPAFVLPDGMKGIGALFKAIGAGGLSHAVQEITALRASQINGCSACVHAHTANLRKAGEPTERVDSVAAWREAPFYSDAERAALAFTEAVTRLADRSGDAVPDELWEDVSRHFDESELAALLLSVAVTNMFNRLNAAVKEPAGATW